MVVDGQTWSTTKTHKPAPTQTRGTFHQPILLDDDEENVSPTSLPKSRKHKRKAVEYEVDQDVTYGNITKKAKSSTKPKPKSAAKKEPEEKRLRRFRKHAPSSFQEISARALTQRFCILDRQRVGTLDQPAETLEIAGTTGNVYSIRIDNVPSCDCPHAMKGNQCKHIVYVMMRTLKAPSHLAYQLALTTSELKTIFAAAPPLPSEVAASDDANSDGNRKPLDDDCPICYDAFDEHEKSTWCKHGCGNNIHTGCFEKWATQKKQVDGKVTCPFCRALWRDDDLKIGNLKGTGTVTAEGYRNVAQELGLSGRRDYSSYHSYWVNRQRRDGLIDDSGYDDRW